MLRAGMAGFSRFLFPLAVYYATTLGVPLVNGAFRQSEFWEHSAFVLLIPLVLLTPLALFRIFATKVASLRPRRRLADPTMLSQDFD